MSKCELIRIRVTKKDKADWTAEAHKANVSVAEWIRNRCNERIGRDNPPSPSPAPAEQTFIFRRFDNG